MSDAWGPQDAPPMPPASITLAQAMGMVALELRRISDELRGIRWQIEAFTEGARRDDI